MERCAARDSALSGQLEQLLHFPFPFGIVLDMDALKAVLCPRDNICQYECPADVTTPSFRLDLSRLPLAYLVHLPICTSSHKLRVPKC